MVRTERGRDLLARAVKAGSLELTSISMTEVAADFSPMD